MKLYIVTYRGLRRQLLAGGSWSSDECWYYLDPDKALQKFNSIYDSYATSGAPHAIDADFTESYHRGRTLRVCSITTEDEYDFNGALP